MRRVSGVNCGSLGNVCCGNHAFLDFERYSHILCGKEVGAWKVLISRIAQVRIEHTET